MNVRDAQLVQSIRSVNISGIQNLENELSKVLKEEEYKMVYKAKLDGAILNLYFRYSKKKRACYVKQISKKKYPEISEYIKKSGNEVFSLTCLVSLPKVWLVFFKK